MEQRKEEDSLDSCFHAQAHSPYVACGATNLFLVVPTPPSSWSQEEVFANTEGLGDDNLHRFGPGLLIL